jgi:hypothetical protein
MNTNNVPIEISAEEFDRKFEEGEDITPYLDLSKARRPGREIQRVNVDFPVWMLQSLDKEAARLGINRQAIIKVWIADRLRTEQVTV